MQRRSAGRWPAAWLALLGLLPLDQSLSAQSGAPDRRDWIFRSSVFASGDSRSSSPDGYKVYSAIGLEVGLDRRLSGHWALGLVLRPESREVDSIASAGPRLREGSLELLATNLTVKYRLKSAGKWQPYVGAGVNFTFAWEKTGVLDSLDVSPSVGPAVQVGLDVGLSSCMLFNIDLGWNTEQPDLEAAGRSIAQLNIDPVSLGVGLGFRF